MVLDVAFPVLFSLFSFLKDKEDALTFITLWFDVEANIAARVVVQFYPPSRRTNSAVWPIFCFLTFYSFLPSFLFFLVPFFTKRRPWRRSNVPHTTTRLLNLVRKKKRPLVDPFSLLLLFFFFFFFFFLQPFFDIRCSHMFLKRKGTDKTKL